MSERRKSSSSRRTSGNRKVNRAQKKAMEVRTAESVAVQPVIQQSSPDADNPVSRFKTRTRRRSANPVAAKPVLLTRAQEYAFIHSDFRRLLITAGSLLTVMLVLLFIVE